MAHFYLSTGLRLPIVAGSSGMARSFVECDAEILVPVDLAMRVPYGDTISIGRDRYSVVRSNGSIRGEPVSFGLMRK